jgi:transketolase
VNEPYNLIENTKMNTTPTNIAEQIKAYFNQVKAEKQAVIDQYESDLSKLKSEKDNKIKEINSKWDEIRKAIPSLDSEKSVKTSKKRIKDAEISLMLQEILTNSSASMKTEDLFKKIGIQRPRFDKYTKSPECIIKAEKAGKTKMWSLK